MVQKYLDGDCRRRGPGYVQRSGGGGRGHKATAASRSGYRDLGESAERREAKGEPPIVVSGSSGGFLAGLLLPLLLGRGIGRSVRGR